MALQAVLSRFWQLYASNSTVRDRILMTSPAGNIPQVHPRLISLGIIHFSEKSIVYIILMLLSGRGLPSLVPIFAGIVSNSLVRFTLLQKLRVPRLLAHWIGFLAPIVETVPPSVRNQARPNRVPEQAIQQLMNLGFDRQQAVRALVAANNNVQVAAHRLLQ